MPSARSQPEIEDFNKRRKMIGYTMCNDIDIWNIMDKEKAQEQEAKQPKPATPITPASITNLNAFLLDTFQNSWNYNQEQLDLVQANLKAKNVPQIIPPSQIDWDQRRQDIDASKSGQYTLNPETQSLDYAKAKVFIPTQKTLKPFEGKPLSDLAKHIQATYGNKYYIPGLEYWQYVSIHPDKAPPQLKDTNNYYFYFGSILRSRGGHWCVSYSRWDGSSFKRDACWLDRGWGSSCRVVLLER